MVESILVTGASGFFGRNIVASLSSDYDLLTPDRSELELLDPNSVNSYCSDNNFQCVIHLAHPDRSVSGNQEQAMTMLANLLEGVPTGSALIHFGTCLEYSDFAGKCVECDPAPGTTSYGVAKAQCREHLEKIKHDLRSCVVFRPFFVFGPHEAPKRLVPYLVHQLVAGGHAELGDPQQARDFVPISLVVQALRAALKKLDQISFEIINIGSGQTLTIGEIVKIVSDELCIDSSELVSWRGAAEGDIPSICADESRLRDILGVESVDVELALREYVRGLKADGVKQR